MAMIDVMDAVKVKRRYRGDNVYFLLSNDADGNPYALDISVSGEVINIDQGALSNIDAMATLTSLAIREYDVDYVAARLLQVSRGEHTLPAIIADVLLEYGTFGEVKK